MLNVKCNKGFSLIEILISMAIFLTVILIVSDIFVSTTTMQKQTLREQKALNDLNNVIEQIAQYVRVGKINYDTPYLYPSDQLNLNLDGDDYISIWQVDSTETKSIYVNYRLDDGQIHGGYLTPESTKTPKFDYYLIENLDFYISPMQDPTRLDLSSNEYLSNQQPIVTIVIDAIVLTESNTYLKNVKLQTTVNSRSYAR
jgi:prepilin-type N-terminal cleavage/methylation domain-containing protein